MSSYESAPATSLLSTTCAACGRPLLDAVSVECGLGPICREKNGYDAHDEHRAEANALVHAVALGDVAKIARLEALGFVRLARTLRKRLLGRVTVEITELDGTLIVSAPYREEALEAWRSIPGRVWSQKARAYYIPATERRALWCVLKAHYSGESARGPKGDFTI